MNSLRTLASEPSNGGQATYLPLAQDLLGVLKAIGPHKVEQTLSAMDLDANGELDLYEFLDGVKQMQSLPGASFKNKPTRAQAQALFDRMADMDDVDDDEDEDTIISDLLRRVAEHKWRLARMPALVENDAAKPKGRRKLPLEQIMKDANEIDRFVSELEEKNPTRPGSDVYQDTHGALSAKMAELQRMQANMKCALATSLRRRLMDYCKTLGVTTRRSGRVDSGVQAFIRKASSIVDGLSSAASPARSAGDQPYGLPMFAPNAPKNSLRGRCRRKILEQLDALHDPEGRLASSYGAEPSSGGGRFGRLRPHDGSTEFKIMLVDQAASRMLGRFCGVFDLVDAGVCFVDDIRQVRESHELLEAVYLVAPTPNNINFICKDFDENAADGVKYKTAHVLFIGKPPTALLSKLVASVGAAMGVVEEMQLDFLTVDDHTFDLALEGGEHDNFEDLSAPHYQNAVADQLSQVCTQLDISRPLIRWHDSSAALESRGGRLADSVSRASEICSTVAELTHQKLLDRQTVDAIDEEEYASLERLIDEKKDALRGAIVKRNHYLDKQRAQQRALMIAEGSSAAVFEGMELDAASARRLFGVTYVEGHDYDFVIKPEDREMWDPSATLTGSEDGSEQGRHKQWFFTDKHGSKWELEFDVKDLDWETAGTRDAGVHLCNFRLWRCDKNVKARRATLEKMDQAIRDAEQELWETEDDLEESATTQLRGTYDRPQVNEKHRYHHTVLERKSKAAASTRVKARSRVQPDPATGILIVHRLFDIIAPLMHDCTYEAAFADVIDNRTLEDIPEHIFRGFAIRRDPSRLGRSSEDSKEINYTVHSQVDTLKKFYTPQSEVGKLLQGGLRTTAEWARFRDKDVHMLADELAKESSSSARRTPRHAMETQELSYHQHIVSILRESFKQRDLKGLSEWERELLTGGTAKSSVRASAVTGVLWERTKERAEFEIPAFRRMLSKVTHAGDKARLALIFIFSRWEPTTSQKPSRAEEWKLFVVDEGRRIGRFYDSQTSASAMEPSHAHQFKIHYAKLQCIESLMLNGGNIGGEPVPDRWDGDDHVWSGAELRKLREKAYILDASAAPSGDLKGYVRDEAAADRYESKLRRKWDLFQTWKSREMGADGPAYELEKEHYENFIDYDASWKASSSRLSAENAKSTMREILSDTATATDDVAYKTMLRLCTSKQERDAWNKMPHERKLVEFAKFKKFELYFEAYYSWRCAVSEAVPQDSVLADRWIKKLLRSLKIDLTTVLDIVRCCSGPADARYGYRVRSALKLSGADERTYSDVIGGLQALASHAKSHKAGQPKRGPYHLRPSLFYAGREFVADKLDQAIFPYARSQEPFAAMRHSVTSSAGVSQSPERVPLQKVVIFVIGGLTFWEMRTARAIAKEMKCEVFIGGTDLITSDRMLKMLRVIPSGSLDSVQTKKKRRGQSTRRRRRPTRDEVDRAFAEQCERRRHDTPGIPALTRSEAETAVESLVRVRHTGRSVFSRAFRAALKDRDGAVSRQEFDIVVENMLLIDLLMEEFEVKDSADELQLSLQDFKTGCALATDFLGGHVKYDEAEREFRKISIDGHVLFDELCEWLTERKRKAIGAPSMAYTPMYSPTIATDTPAHERTARSPIADRDR